MGKRGGFPGGGMPGKLQKSWKRKNLQLLQGAVRLRLPYQARR